MPIRKVISRSILDGTVAPVDTTGVYPNISIGALSASIASTAVDTFVYDTRKDSDGGAWRKRTNHTSWYNETLNTATRGSRRDFPAVAVIVATNTEITIYDGDSADMPMWMVFQVGSGKYVNNTSGSGVLTSVAALNAQIAWAGFRLGRIDFARDYGDMLEEGYYNWFVTPISTRNSSLSSYSTVGSRISNNYTNDVAMTVLPNAPVNALTGLPIPTIAVATNAGISVVHNTGEVNTINATDATEYNVWRSVGFTKDYKLIINSTYSGVNNNIIHVCDIPYVNFSGSVVNTRITPLNSRYYHSDSSIPNMRPAQGSGLAEVVSTGINSLAIGTNAGGLNLVAEAPETVSGVTSSSMIAHVMPTYNTGWMPGNIKGAWLSDTTTETLSASELVSNGNFTTNTTGWTGTNATLSVVGGELLITSTIASGNAIADQTISGLVVGKTYIISAVGRNSLNTTQYAGINGVTNGASQNSATSSPFSFQFVAATTSIGLRLFFTASGVGQVVYFDSVSVRLAEVDRSVANFGLLPFGSITKAPVNTGCDLVGYTFPTAGDYFEQPYKSSIGGIGTGDFCVMGWFRNAQQSVTFFDIASAASPRFFVATMYGSTNNLWIYMDTAAGILNWTPSPFYNVVNVDAWQFVAVKRSGITMSVSVNGSPWFDNTATEAGGSLNSTSRVTLGQNYTQGSLAGHKQALWRFTTSVPTSDQIAKIYNDEKMLFVAGAKACLYSTSSAVTDVAYDDSTDLLHVGTASGRSVFDGLRRMDNTTTAVTTAISASNGLVAEQ